MAFRGPPRSVRGNRSLTVAALTCGC
jgi:hypothetical protein